MLALAEDLVHISYDPTEVITSSPALARIESRLLNINALLGLEMFVDLGHVGPGVA